MFGGKGPVAAVRNVAVTLLSTLQTRLALLANEFQVEKQQVIQQLTLGLALVFCLGVGVLLIVALAVLVWWEQRLLVVGLFAVLFMGLAGYFLMALRRSTASATPVLAATLAELQEDLHQLRASASGASDEPPAR
ncbi:MAG: phage holin family protein [Polaromonas sp.]|nr:phage holin family protein [Polaromonas sp.]